MEALYLLWRPLKGADERRRRKTRKKKNVCELLMCLSTLSDLHQAGDDDGNESNNFGVGEEVLDSGAPLDISAVDKGQQT